MSIDETWGPEGRLCRSITRFVHQCAGFAASRGGPVQFDWTSGECTLLDVNTDWSLEVAQRLWSDPYRLIAIHGGGLV